jgi:hypothetical protein
MATNYRGTSQDGAGVQSSPAFVATQLMVRTVWDRIKLNFAQNVKLLALVDGGTTDDGGLNKKAGLIKKWQVDSKRFESFNYTPVAAYKTVSSFSGTTLTLDDTLDLVPYKGLMNTANKTYCRIDSRTTDYVVEVTSYGTTAFSANPGDVLMPLASIYPENSSAPTIHSKDFDNVYNTLQISRRPVAISNSMLKSKFLAGGDYFKLLKSINEIEFYREIERTFMFGDRASGIGNTTSGGSALSTAFSTSRGVYGWAANTYDMKGAMTGFKLRKDIPQLLKTVQEDQTVMAVGGFETLGRINEIFNDRVTYFKDSDGTTLSKFGVKTKTLNTMNMPIELLRHEAFEYGDNAKELLLFSPENIFFSHLKDRDIKPNVGIQNNDLDGMIDEIICEAGCGVIDGGQSILVVKNCW